MTVSKIAVLFLTCTIAAITAAQVPARDPQPEGAMRAILAAFDTHRVVAIGDYHFTKDLNDFVLTLVRHPEFPNTVNDIVVENISSQQQPTLDRYVGGEDVPIEEARRLWREAWNTSWGVNDFHVQLFQLVRQINSKLPPAGRLRVLAGEEPKDWGKAVAEGRGNVIGKIVVVDGIAVQDTREGHIASVVEQQVLAKNRKALMFYGSMHVAHGIRGMAKDRYEQKYPGVTFVIETYLGSCGIPEEGAQPWIDRLAAYETKMRSWPVPSIVHTKGTWLAEFAKWKWTAITEIRSTDPIDAYLYLGAPDLLLSTQPSVFTFTDGNYLEQIRRSLGETAEFWGKRIDPDKVRELDRNVLRCDGTRPVAR